MQPKELSYEEIAVGDIVSFEASWSEADVHTFAALSGDRNPLHVDPDYAATTKFEQQLVHGMLTASSCSKLVGMYLPGKKCLYLKQTLAFKQPVFIGDTLTVSGAVVSKSNITRMIEIQITITKYDQTVLEGTATVQVLA